MKNLIIFFGLFFGSMVYADTMICPVAVYKAQDLKEGQDDSQSLVVVSAPLSDGMSETQAQVNGETVILSLYKKPYADLYMIDIVLKTPVADLPPRVSYVAAFDDFIYNDGPATDDGWTPNPGPNNVRYVFLQMSAGGLTLTPKAKKALQDDGKWGQYPFTSAKIDATQASYVAEAMPELLSKNLLQPTDVVAVGTVLGCTLTK